jgi:hypothetical protein
MRSVSSVRTVSTYRSAKQFKAEAVQMVLETGPDVRTYRVPELGCGG